MPEPDDLTSDLRRLVQHLDSMGTPATPDVAMSREPPRRSRHRARVAALAVAALALGALIVVRRGDDDATPVDAIDRGTTTTTEVSIEPAPAPNENRARFTVPPESWPVGGIAVTEGDAVLFLNNDGEELGQVVGAIAAQVERASSPQTIAVRSVGIFELGEPDTAEAPDGCDTAAGAGGVRVALCGGQPQLRSQIVRVAPDGGSTVLADAAPGGTDGGHWRWALPSPDGRWVLAQWSGECEVPTAFLISVDGGELRTVDGAPGVGDQAAESVGVGWTDDGRAIVRYRGGLCGAGIDEPGTYRLDPASGEATLVRADPRDTGSSYTWRRDDSNGNAPERSIARALTELGLEPCCGEPSHGGENATTGAVWDGLDVPVFGGPKAPLSFEGDVYVPFNDLVLDPATIEIDGLSATVGRADGYPFLAFTCGANLWALGSVGFGEDPASPASLEALARALMPRLYCTVGEPPRATGHGPAGP